MSDQPRPNVTEITHRDAATPRPKPTGNTHTFQLRRFRGQFVEMEDIHFHHDSAVTLPDHGVHEHSDAHQSRITGLVVIAALISPYAADRAAARALRPPGGFIEVHLDASLAECEARDAKGLYRRARTGALPGFTGIDAPYEPPAAPELRLPTGRCRVEEAVAAVLAEIDRRIGDSPTAG